MNKAQQLQQVAQKAEGCTLCPLSQSRNKIVMGQGNPDAKLVFLGESPGQTEDETGLAFVGRAGQLLTKMITAMKLTREEVFILNICKCRPPNNRPPTLKEMNTCSPFLIEQLETIKPQIICALGKTAAVGLDLLDPIVPLNRIRGTWQEWRGIPVMVTFHPSYLLRSPNEKSKSWEDLKKIMERLNMCRVCGDHAPKDQNICDGCCDNG